MKRTRLERRVLADIFGEIIDGPMDFLVEGQGKQKGFLKSQTLKFFGCPLSVRDPETSEVTIESLWGEDMVKIMLNLSPIQSYFEKKREGRNWKTLRSLLGDTKMELKVGKLEVTFEDEIVIVVDGVEFNVSEAETTVKLGGMKLLKGDFIIMEQGELLIDLTSGLSLKIDQVLMKLPGKPGTSLFKLQHFLWEMVTTETCEVRKKEDLSIEQTKEEKGKPRGVTIGKLVLETSSGSWDVKGISITEEVTVDSAAVDGVAPFSLGRISYGANGLRIMKFAAPLAKQMQVRFPFLGTKRTGNQVSYQLAGLVCGGTVLQAKTLIVNLMHELVNWCNFADSEGDVRVVQAPTRFVLDNGLIIELETEVNVRGDRYQVSLRNLGLRLGNADPITTGSAMQFTFTGKKLQILISPSNVTVTPEELSTLVDTFRDLLTSGNIAHAIPVNLSIVATDVIISQNTDGHKENLLMGSCTDVVVDAVNLESVMTANFNINICMRWWNPITYCWNVLVESFNAEVSLRITKELAVVRAEILCPVSVLVGRDMLKKRSDEPVKAMSRNEIDVWNRLGQPVQIITYNSKVQGMQLSSSFSHFVSWASKKESSSDEKKLGDTMESEVLIEPNETRCVRPGNDYIDIPTFRARIKVGYLVDPVFLAPNIVCQRVVLHGRQTITFTWPYSTHNFTSSRLKLWFKDGDSVQTTIIGPDEDVFFPHVRKIYVSDEDKSAEPKKWFEAGDLPVCHATHAGAISIVKSGSEANTVFEIRSLYVVKNDCPCTVICSLFSEACAGMVSTEPNSTKDLMIRCLDITKLDMTCCPVHVGESKTTRIRKIPFFKQLTLKDWEMSVMIEKNDFGQYVVRCYVAKLIRNETDRDLIFMANGQRLVSVPSDSAREIVTAKLADTVSIALDSECPYADLPKTSSIQKLETATGKFLPLMIEVSESDKAVVYCIKPVLVIRNLLDCELVFSDDELTFSVKAHSEKSAEFINNDRTFSIAVGSYGRVKRIALGFPLSTVFRTGDYERQKVIRLTIEDKNGVLVSTFEDAKIPYPFVVVNQLESLPIFVQQLEESFPIKVEPQSSSFFAFEEPFIDGSITVTISGKSQLIPLNTLVEGSLFPFRVGSKKITADVVLLSEGIRGLVIGHEPWLPPERKFRFTFNIADVSVAFIDKHQTECILVWLSGILVQWTHRRIRFQVGSCQIDDQRPMSGVVLKSAETGSPWAKFCLEGNTEKVKGFSATIGDVDVQLNDDFVQLVKDAISEWNPFAELLKYAAFSDKCQIAARKFEISPFSVNIVDNYSDPNVPTKVLTLDVGSFSAQNLTVSGSCLHWILSKHYNNYIEPSIKSLHDTFTFPVSEVAISKFHCDALSSCVAKESKSAELSPISQFARSAPFQGVREDDTVLRLINYKDQHCDFIWKETSGAALRKRMGKRRRSQITYCSRISHMSTDKIATQAIVGQELSRIHRKERILLVENCDRGMFCVTDTIVFMVEVSTKSILNRYDLPDIRRISSKEKVVSMSVIVPGRWKNQSKVINMVFQSEDIALYVCLVITSQGYKSNVALV